MKRNAWTMLVLIIGCCPDRVVIRPINLEIRTENLIQSGTDIEQTTRQRVLILRDGRIEIEVEQ